MTDMIEYHKMMLSDRYRTNAFKRAIFEIVKPGDVVLDLGAGTGILSFFACMAGAKRVYAVELDNVIEIAKELARDNNLRDKIIFINNVSTDISLPEKVDIIISEILGSFGLEEDIMDYIADARERFLKKGGLIMPSSIQIFLVPVEVKDIYDDINFWGKNRYGIKFGALRKMAINNQYNRYIEKKNYLSKPLLLESIDLYKASQSNFNETAGFTLTREGIFHGLAGWFEARLSEKITLSTASPDRTPSWDIAFFPVDKLHKVNKGDHITSKVSLSKWRRNVMWNWDIKIESKSGKIVRFNHSTFRGFPMSKESFKKLSPEHQPRLNATTKIDQYILNQCNGKTPVLQIAKKLHRKYPDIYHSLEKALKKTISVISFNC